MPFQVVKISGVAKESRPRIGSLTHQNYLWGRSCWVNVAGLLGVVEWLRIAMLGPSVFLSDDGEDILALRICLRSFNGFKKAFKRHFLLLLLLHLKYWFSLRFTHFHQLLLRSELVIDSEKLDLLRVGAMHLLLDSSAVRCDDSLTCHVCQMLQGQ